MRRARADPFVVAAYYTLSLYTRPVPSRPSSYLFSTHPVYLLPSRAALAASQYVTRSAMLHIRALVTWTVRTAMRGPSMNWA